MAGGEVQLAEVGVAAVGRRVVAAGRLVEELVGGPEPAALAVLAMWTISVLMRSI